MDLDRAIREVSEDGRFWFSARHVYFELLRRGEIDEPVTRAARVRLRQHLMRHVRTRGPIPKLVSASSARRARRVRLPPDVFDYSVRRVLVFDRLETLLVFAKNGFHLKIEVALVGPDDFPRHVSELLVRQLDQKMPTFLYGVHDVTPTGIRRVQRAAAPFRRLGARWTDTTATLLERAPTGFLEELPPLEMMRFVYGRIARSAEDVGFG